MTLDRVRKCVPLSEDHVGQAGHLLSLAFFDNPLLQYIFPDERKRTRLSPSFFSAFVRYGHLAGEASTTEGSVDGVAVWFPPDAGETDPDLMEQAGVNALPSIIGVEPFDRAMTVIGHCDRLHARDVPFRHWYLSLVGVDPKKQGQGVASALLRPTLARADAESFPCYLETVEPTNVPFYRRLGFKVVVEDVEQSSGIRLWTFLREADERDVVSRGE